MSVQSKSTDLVKFNEKKSKLPVKFNKNEVPQALELVDKDLILKNREQVNQMLAQKVPLNKFVKPNEIAEAVAFLSSSLSSSTTGQILSIDAGQSAF